jgi:hypothetical protein
MESSDWPTQVLFSLLKGIQHFAASFFSADRRDESVRILEFLIAVDFRIGTAGLDAPLGVSVPDDDDAAWKDSAEERASDGGR